MFQGIDVDKHNYFKIIGILNDLGYDNSKYSGKMLKMKTLKE